MTATAFAQPEKSTTVRPNTLTAQEAARRFGEPPPPVAPRVPEVTGVATERVTLQVRARKLALYR